MTLDTVRYITKLVQVYTLRLYLEFHRHGTGYFMVIINDILWIIGGQGSSVGITTEYGLDGPGSNPGGDEIFRPSRPGLGSTQPPVKWVPGLSRGVKCGRGVLLTTHPLLVPRSWKSRAISPPTF